MRLGIRTWCRNYGTCLEGLRQWYYGCAVKHEILGRKGGAGNDPLVPLQKAYGFEADGMNILSCTSTSVNAVARRYELDSKVVKPHVEVTVLPSISYLSDVNCFSQMTESNRLMYTRPPPCDVLENFQE